MEDWKIAMKTYDEIKNEWDALYEVGIKSPTYQAERRLWKLLIDRGYPLWLCDLIAENCPRFLLPYHLAKREDGI